MFLVVLIVVVFGVIRYVIIRGSDVCCGLRIGVFIVVFFVLLFVR